jgi:hypothetical protein
MFTLLLFILTPYVKAQTPVTSVLSDATRFCDTTQIALLVGTFAKIKHEGGIYEDLHKLKDFHFPTKEMRKRGGKSGWGKCKPQKGDIGKIVYATANAYDAVGSANVIYIIQIKDIYVPVACGYLTDANPLDSDKELEMSVNKDSLQYVSDGTRCLFLGSGNQDCWRRLGLVTTDIVSQTFACNLTDSLGVDTLLVCKHVFDNDASTGETTVIFWQYQGKGYVAIFPQNKQYLPLDVSAIAIDWSDIYPYHFSQSDTGDRSKTTLWQWVLDKLQELKP